jgi:RHS repeat-associated protein
MVEVSCFYLYNAHGDVVQRTNASGSLTKAYVYDAFGVETNPDAADTNPFRYCAEYFDKETGSIYLRARYYDPSVGGFMSEDPVRDGLNWYTYAGNNPILFIDPSGLAFVPLREYLQNYVHLSWIGYDIIWNEQTATARVEMFDVSHIIGAEGSDIDLRKKGAGYSFKVGVQGTHIRSDNRMYVREEVIRGVFDQYITLGQGIELVSPVEDAAVAAVIASAGKISADAISKLGSMPSSAAETGSTIVRGTNGNGPIPINLQLFANKSDIKMINDAARQIGVDRVDFGNYVHAIKAELGMLANQNFTYQELLELAKDLLDN